MQSHQELLLATACDIVDRLRRNDISPHDLLDALEARISDVDGKVNALPTLCFDRARARADALTRKPASERGLLAGLPVPIKDLTAVAGRSHHPRFADFPRPYSGAVGPSRGSPRSQWRAGLRQVEHAGIRRRRQHL